MLICFMVSASACSRQWSTHYPSVTAFRNAPPPKNIDSRDQDRVGLSSPSYALKSWAGSCM